MPMTIFHLTNEMRKVLIKLAKLHTLSLINHRSETATRNNILQTLNGSSGVNSTKVLSTRSFIIYIALRRLLCTNANVKMFRERAVKQEEKNLSNRIRRQQSNAGLNRTHTKNDKH
uniref:Uncharacterized protein n=1 Tax=Glossina palpalis gambiensis TaxID=67801 RepID=A0A1B0B5S6_9MUSC